MQRYEHQQHNRYQTFQAAIMLLLFGVALTIASNWVSKSFANAADVTSQTYEASREHAASMQKAYDGMASQYRIAQRLRARLIARNMPAPSLQSLVAALATRRELLTNSVQLTFRSDQGDAIGTWQLALSEHPSLAPFVLSSSSASAEISHELISQYLKERNVPGITYPIDVVLESIDVIDGVHRAALSGVAKPGYTFEAEAAATAIINAIENNRSSVALSLTVTEGQLINETTYELGDLRYLARGASNFRGSTWGRKMNVHKALNEHVNNVVVPPGEVFSFNSLLGGGVNTQNGWFMAKVIFGGEELRTAPGGGICQASTTVFRAAANAGLPLLEHRNHSLYVHYYEKYGVGLDATIYPGSQDLSFINNTGDYLLLQAYADGFDAYVTMYGTSDGRTVDMKGPYFASNAPADFRYEGRRLYSNEVAWVQTVTFADGRSQKEVILSRYKKGIPSTVARKYNTVAGL